MRRSRAALNTPLVYIDSCVYLDLITRNSRELHAETNEERWRSAKAVFDAVNNDQVRLAASALTEAEVLCNGDTRAKQVTSDRVRELVRRWFNSDSTAWTDVDRFLARDAVSVIEEYRPLRAKPDKRIKSADAMHLAAAVRLQADYLMTHDGGFPIGHSISGVQVIRPKIIWQETLFEAASGE